MSSAYQSKLSSRDIAVFGLLGALMYASKLLMEALPNIHLLGMLICSITLVYRVKALYPLYTYILLDGLFSGFATWWLPYLYVWTVLWAFVMLLPLKLSLRTRALICIPLSALHGLGFGVLYAPAQALLYGLNLKGMLAWIAAGFPFDLIHGISNLFTGLLILPLTMLLTRLARQK